MKKKPKVFKIFSLVGLLFILFVLSSPRIVYATTMEWWDTDWNYRVQLIHNVSQKEYIGTLLDYEINFTSLIDNPALSLDYNSLRLIEYNSSEGTIIPYNATLTEIPYQVYTGSDFNITTNAKLKLSWVGKNTSVGSERHYYIYFDTDSNPIQK